MKCVDLAVADFSPAMGMDALLPSSTKPFNLFSKEEEVVCLLEFKTGATVEKLKESELNVDHTTIDMNKNQHINCSSNALVNASSEDEEQDEEKQ
jgi:hypothetical protein